MNGITGIPIVFFLTWLRFHSMVCGLLEQQWILGFLQKQVVFPGIPQIHSWKQQPLKDLANPGWASETFRMVKWLPSFTWGPVCSQIIVDFLSESAENTVADCGAPFGFLRCFFFSLVHKPQRFSMVFPVLLGFLLDVRWWRPTPQTIPRPAVSVSLKNFTVARMVRNMGWGFIKAIVTWGSHIFNLSRSIQIYPLFLFLFTHFLCEGTAVRHFDERIGLSRWFQAFFPQVCNPPVLQASLKNWAASCFFDSLLVQPPATEFFR